MPHQVHEKDFFQRIVANIGDMVSVVDLKGNYIYLSPSHKNLMGYEPEELMGKSGLKLFHPEDIPGIRKKMLLCLATRKSVSSIGRISHKDGSYVHLEGIGTPILNKFGLPEMILVVSRDISSFKEREEKLIHMALHDHLTGLPNRALILDRCQHEIERATRAAKKLAVVIVDIDKFKSINDTYGHAAGDQLICAVGSRIHNSLRKEDTVGRLGGDEFAVLISQPKDVKNLTKILNKILSIFERPISLDGNKIKISISMGASLFPEHGENFDSLYRTADAALYETKECGGDSWTIRDTDN